MTDIKTTKADEIFVAAIGVISLLFGIFTAFAITSHWSTIETWLKWVGPVYASTWVYGGIWILIHTIPIRPRIYRVKSR